ncbi:MAG: hypothetical protein ACYTAF_10270, partial [Planctomycetota bacterium]
MSDAKLDRAIGDVRGRWRTVRVLEAAALLGVVLFGGALVLFLLDNLFHLGAVLRTILGAALLGGAIYVWVRFMLLPLLHPISDEGSAILIERTHPDLDNRLINALRLRRVASVPVFIVRLITTEAADLVGRLELRRVLPLKALKSIALAAGAAFVLFIAYAVLMPEYMTNAFQRYTNPGTYIPPITRTTLKVSPGDARVVEGSPLLIRAEVGGEIPSHARVAVNGEGGYDMKFMGDHFAFEFRSVEKAFTYAVQAGDAESDRFQVSVVLRPRIEQLRVELTYPEYLGLEPKIEDPSSGHVSAVEGTQVKISGKPTKPFKKVAVAIEDGETLPVRGPKWRFEVKESFRFRFTFTDRDGLQGEGPACSVTALKDDPPKVRIVKPERSMRIRPETEIAVVVQASDDFGLAALELQGTRPGQKPASFGSFEVGRREVRASKTIRMQDLGAQSGETVALTAVARDLKGNVTVSTPVRIQVVSSIQARLAILKELKGIVARLKEILRRQKGVKLRTRVQSTVEKPDVDDLAAKQYGILKDLVAVHQDWKNPDTRHLAA